MSTRQLSRSRRSLLPYLALPAVSLVGTVAASEPFFLPGEDPKPAGQKSLLVENMSDEFDGSVLDRSKWQDDPVANGWKWYGRAPGRFRAENVQLNDGKLCITVSQLDAPVVRHGKTFTHQGAIVRSLHPGQPGWYFECRMKANATVMSSTFRLISKPIQRLYDDYLAPTPEASFPQGLGKQQREHRAKAARQPK